MAKYNFLGIKFGKEAPQKLSDEQLDKKIDDAILNYFTMTSNNNISYAEISPNINYDFSNPTEIESVLSGRKWIWFGVDNLYPDLCVQLYKGSPTLFGILNFQVTCTIAGGFTIETQGDDFIEKTKASSFAQTHFNRMFLKELAINKAIHGWAGIKVYWDSKHKQIQKLDVVPTERIRKGIDGCEHNEYKNYFLCNNWSKVNQVSSVYDYRPKEIPAFNKFKNEKEQLYVYSPITPGLVWHTQPDWVGAINNVMTDAQHSYFHKQNLVNSVNISAILTLIGEVNTPEQAKEIERRTKIKLAGLQNTGGIAIFTAKDKELMPTLTSFPANQLGEAFIPAKISNKEDIATACNIDPALAGSAKAGSWGNVQQIESSFGIYQKEKIENEQQDLESILNEFLKAQGFTKSKIKFNNYKLF